MSNSTIYINKGYVATWKFFLGSLCVVAQKAMNSVRVLGAQRANTNGRNTSCAQVKSSADVTLNSYTVDSQNQKKCKEKANNVRITSSAGVPRRPT